MTSIQIKNKGEKQFAELLEKQAIKFVHQPKPLHFKNLKYTPDFYLPEKGEYIEVVGTRQAYSANKEKIQLFQSRFKLKCVRPNGDSWDNLKKFVRHDLRINGRLYFSPLPIPKRWQGQLNWLTAQQQMFEYELDKKNQRIILRRSK